MTTITYRILKFLQVIKKAIAANYTFFAVVTFSNINSLAKINFYRNTAFTKPNFHQVQKGFHQENLSLTCLQFSKYTCLDTLAGNICFCKK